MDFGKLSNIKNVDFTLPPDHPETLKILRGLPKREGLPRVYVGCTGWVMKEWIGHIYPKGTGHCTLVAQFANSGSAVCAGAILSGLVSIAKKHNTQSIRRLALAMGSVSYGVYLFHNAAPLALGSFQASLTPGQFLAICVTATLLVSTSAYIFIEKPLRELGRALGRAVDRRNT